MPVDVETVLLCQDDKDINLNDMRRNFLTEAAPHVVHEGDLQVYKSYGGARSEECQRRRLEEATPTQREI
jgi:hypothetical protein